MIYIKFRVLLLGCALALLNGATVISGRQPPGSSYNYGFDVRDIAKRQAPQQVVTVQKLASLNGSALTRPDIRAIRGTPMFHMFILGMDMMMWSNQNNPVSWYQMAGKSHRRCLFF